MKNTTISKNKNLIYNDWLISNYVPQDMKDQMAKMTDDDIAASFKDEPLKFGTAGYRAKTGPGPLFLNNFSYQQLAVGYARYIINHFEQTKKNAKPKVIIVHDNRLNGNVITFNVANVLTSFGIAVYLAPENLPLPTPIVSFVARHFHFDGAINLTASHNPKEYNGFKAYNNLGAQVSVEQANEISNLLPPTNQNLATKYISKPELIKYLTFEQTWKYFKSVTAAIGFNKLPVNHCPIIFTSHHGTCSIWAMKYLKELGYNIIPVITQCYTDPNFVNSPVMNPEDPASFEAALTVAQDKKSDIIIGVDPDGDRMAVAIKHHGKWVYLTGNETGILATNYLLQYHNTKNLLPVVVSTYVTNTLINKIVEEYNGMVIRTATGFKNIAIAMEYIEPTKAKFVVGFEEAIGMCISDQIREKDGIAATAIILEMYNFYKLVHMDLLDVLQQKIYTKFGHWYGETVSIKIPGANWQEKAAELEHTALSVKPMVLGNFAIQEVFWNEAGSCIEWKLGEDNWIKFRISGTEPKFKIYYNLYFNYLNKTDQYDRDKCKDEIMKITSVIKKILKL